VREALFYRNLGEGRVECLLCPHHCRLREGQRGVCRLRLAKEGKIFTESYGVCAAIALDPIEKKPLYHFYPGWEIISLGTVGCNMHCLFCQNWELARGEREQTHALTPEGVKDIFNRQTGTSRLGVAYTYNEPTIWYEFIIETAPLIRQAGGVNVMVTNGQIEAEPLQRLLPWIDGFNIDVKAFSEGFYRRMGGSLAAAQRSVEMAAASTHVELTYLIIPGENDSMQEIEAFACWVSQLDREIPVHFSRYFPNYKMNNPPTPIKTMRDALAVASSYLDYVYLGNIAAPEGNHTVCPRCGAVLISRRGYKVQPASLENGCCSKCGYKLKLIGEVAPS